MGGIRNGTRAGVAHPSREARQVVETFDTSLHRAQAVPEDGLARR